VPVLLALELKQK